MSGCQPAAFLPRRRTDPRRPRGGAPIPFDAATTTAPLARAFAGSVAILIWVDNPGSAVTSVTRRTLLFRGCRELLLLLRVARGVFYGRVSSEDVTARHARRRESHTATPVIILWPVSRTRGCPLLLRRLLRKHAGLVSAENMGGSTDQGLPSRSSRVAWPSSPVEIPECPHHWKAERGSDSPGICQSPCCHRPSEDNLARSWKRHGLPLGSRARARAPRRVAGREREQSGVSDGRRRC